MPADVPVVSSAPINLAALVALLVVGIVDLRTRRAPQAVTMPMLAVLGLWRLWRGDGIVFVYWTVALGLWLLHVYGAGDAKVLMIELALWPSPAFIGVLGATVAVLGTIVMIARFHGVGSFLASIRVAGARLLSGRAPSEAELARYGTPQAFLYLAGAGLYLALSFLARYWAGRIGGG